jgi:hypothetical protein
MTKMMRVTRRRPHAEIHRDRQVVSTLMHRFALQMVEAGIRWEAPQADAAEGHW